MDGGDFGIGWQSVLCVGFGVFRERSRKEFLNGGGGYGS